VVLGWWQIPGSESKWEAIGVAQKLRLDVTWSRNVNGWFSGFNK